MVMNDKTKVSTEMSLDKKRRKNGVFLRWLFMNSTAWNYEKYQGLGYAAAMVPALKEIYKDKPDELDDAVKNHMQFFNTNATIGCLILGATLALEEEKGIEAKEAISGLKTGLMGALAGIGDTLFIVLPTTILGSIAAYMALEGSYVGVYLFVGYFLFIKNFVAYYFMNKGYEEGTKLVTTLGGKLKNLTAAANVLGTMVVGGLIASVVKAQVSYEYVNGAVTVPLQSTLDKVMPSLMPLLVVAGAYWLLGQKWMNSTRVIFILLGVGILCHTFGVLA